MTYNRILLPLDGSQLAEFILPHVESLASAFSAEVRLLHVLDGSAAAPSSLTPSQRTARADIAKYLGRIAEALTRKRIPCQWHISTGEPAQEIIRHAADNECDLVMMSTHGLGGQRRRKVGSVAMEVVSAGTTPVMLVRPSERVAAR